MQKIGTIKSISKYSKAIRMLKNSELFQLFHASNSKISIRKDPFNDN